MLRKIWIVLGSVALGSCAYFTAFAVELVQRPLVVEDTSVGAAETNTWTVCAGGCDFTSIQAAVDAASAGDTIELGAEVFFEVFRVHSTANLLIRGQGPSLTVIDGEEFDGSVIALGSPTTLENLTVRNGSNAVRMLGEGANSRLYDCIIDATGGEFGVWVSGASLAGGSSTIDSSTIIGGRVGIVNDDGLVFLNRSTITSAHIGIAQVVDCVDPYDPCEGGCDPAASDDGRSGIITSFSHGLLQQRGHPPGTIISSTLAFNDLGLYGASWCYEEGGELCGVIAGDPDCSPPSFWEVGSTIVVSRWADCQIPVVSLGFSTWRFESCTYEGSDLTGTDPLLLPLADNGGPTPTHALAPGSPAIDAGGDECLPTDQRGARRPQDGDDDGEERCDIGAYEVGVLSVEVQIDIKPASHPNSINPYAGGVIPVAILGSEDFDVANIDEATLRFGPGEAPTAHRHAHFEDVNYDEIMDLMLHFRTRDTGITCGDESATLTGETLDGQPFEGSDSITTIGCRSSRRPAIWLEDQDRPDMPRTDGLVDIERK